MRAGRAEKVGVTIVAAAQQQQEGQGCRPSAVNGSIVAVFVGGCCAVSRVDAAASRMPSLLRHEYRGPITTAGGERVWQGAAGRGLWGGEWGVKHAGCVAKEVAGIFLEKQEQS